MATQWWYGDQRVDKYLDRIRRILDKINIESYQKYAVIDTCYESIYLAILETETSTNKQSMPLFVGGAGSKYCTKCGYSVVECACHLQ